MRVHVVIGKLMRGRRAYPRRQDSDVRWIVVHHSGTSEGSAEAYAREHVSKRGWPGIGYHYVIQPDGEVYKTEPLRVVSNHVGRHNRESVGICMTGNYETRLPSMGALEACVELVAELAVYYHLPASRVRGHCEMAGARTVCPGKLMDMVRLRTAVEGRMATGKVAQMELGALVDEEWC